MITREELFDLVWTVPMVTVAKRFNVSGSYLARVCSRLNVPRPARGYWAKLAVGKALARPALPQARAGDETSWDPDGNLPDISRAASSRQTRRKAPSSLNKPHHTTDSHELIKGIKALFLNGRESRWNSYLKPSKRLLPDILVTKTSLVSALQLADELFKQLEQAGHRVRIASSGENICRPTIDIRDKPDKHNHYADLWSPGRSTVVYVNGTPIGIVIFELTELTQMRYVNGVYIREKDFVPSKSKWAREAHWSSNQDIACGRFAILTYSSYYTENWRRTWKEEHVGDFIKGVAKLAREIASCETEAAMAVKRGKEVAEAEQARLDQIHRDWQKKQEELRLQKALEESKVELDRIIDTHIQASRLENFLQYVESRRQSLDDSTQKKLDELIAQARTLYKSGSTLDEFLTWRPPTERLGLKNN